MVAAFAKGAQENGHQVDVVNVCQKKIAGCLACEYCHKKDSGHERQCVQQDDMQEVYPLLDAAEMIVLASPVYYHRFFRPAPVRHQSHLCTGQTEASVKKRRSSYRLAAIICTVEPFMNIKTHSFCI